MARSTDESIRIREKVLEAFKRVIKIETALMGIGKKVTSVEDRRALYLLERCAKRCHQGKCHFDF